MLIKINKTLTSNPESWDNCRKEYNLEQIRLIKKFDENITLTCSTLFVLQSYGTYAAVGYITEPGIVKTDIFDPVERYYTHNTCTLSLRQIHRYLYYRLELLEDLNMIINDIQEFELSRKVLLYVFRCCDIELELLYNREYQYLKKMEQENPELFKTICMKRTTEELYQDVYRLYHDQPPKHDEFVPVYQAELRGRSSKWN